MSEDINTHPESPSQHHFTSLSSLLLSPDSAKSPAKGKARDSDGDIDRPDTERIPPTGWHLPSVEEGPPPPPSYRRGSRSRSRSTNPETPRSSSRLSVWRMMALTVSMGGSQIAWTVELGYGTPYLLALGLSEQLTSLVWLAGPISGLVVQPLIGAISDSSTSRYRRRFWIVASTMLLVISGLGLAYTEPIAKAIVDLFGGGQGDWDPKSAALVKNTAIGIAVFCFYCLDFALNGLQASLRNLVFDVTPGEQLASANAWNGRFNHIGNIVGFTMGFLNLNNVPIIRLLGGDQFRKVCVVALIILVITVWITCWTQEEDERPSTFRERRSKFKDIVGTIYEAVLHLPRPVRRICMVQIAAFMGWFPYLFYSTTYVSDVMAHELGHPPDRNTATRAGSFALLIYSCVAILAGTLLPYLAARDHRLLRPDADKNGDPSDSADEEDIEMERIRDMVRQWKAEAAREGRPLRLPRMPFMLRNIWTSALVLFFFLMMSTFFITKVWQATVVIALVGICWAVACWVPFAIIMEFLKELDDSSKSDQKAADNGPGVASSVIRPQHARTLSTPGGNWRSQPASPTRPSERTSLLRSYSTADLEGASMEYTGNGPVAGGTIMGIHNLAIVFPQFIIAIVASIIFKIADGDEAHEPTFGKSGERTGVAWVLRFGGLMALVGALICRKVPPTKTEKAMRRRLAEMREESAE